ncbi:type II secretion system F family protein [Nocardiopsis coralliicola]
MNLFLAALGGALLAGGAWVLATALRAAPAPPGGIVLRLRDRVAADRSHLLRLAGAAGAATGVFAVTGWPVGAALAAAGAWWLPGLLGPDRDHQARLARIEAVAAWTEQVRDLIAASSGLQGAIAASAPIAPEAIRTEAKELAAGMRTEPRAALQRWAEAVDVPTADQVAAALDNALDRHAADLAALLSRLAQAARAQSAMLVRVAAGRARVRTSMRIITATTLALAAGLMLFNPGYLEPLNSLAGQVVLAVIGGLWALALVWMARLARTDLGPRVLRPQRQEVAA